MLKKIDSLGPQPEFWDKAAGNKVFNDPFYLDQLAPFIDSNSTIMEYGCGYGRLLNLMFENNYQKLQGFDFSSKMIERGTKLFPHINFTVIEHALIPLPSNSVDAAILSTVLCCVPESIAQKEIINEIKGC